MTARSDAGLTTGQRVRTCSYYDASDVVVSSQASFTEVRLSASLESQSLSKEAVHQERNALKQTRSAALADWHGLLAARLTSGAD